MLRDILAALIHLKQSGRVFHTGQGLPCSQAEVEAGTTSVEREL